MNLRKLGQSDLKITPIGIGAWAIGGGRSRVRGRRVTSMATAFSGPRTS
jgi:aryl-alcohol dehydrogenase-like predicted oxidoreductase